MILGHGLNDLGTWRNNNNIDKAVTVMRIILLALRMGWAGLG